MFDFSLELDKGPYDDSVSSEGCICKSPRRCLWHHNSHDRENFGNVRN